MPFFDYDCVCGQEIIDKMVKNSSDEVTCPACGKPMAKRVCAPRAHGYKLVGDGFYKNEESFKDLRQFEAMGKKNKQLLKGGGNDN